MKPCRIVVLAGLLASQSAWSLTLSGPRCRSFSPSKNEVAALVESSPELPDFAVFEGACYSMQQQLTGVSTLTDVRVETYRFSWPTNQHMADVRFHLRTRCSRTATGPLNCVTPDRFAGWHKVLVRVDPRMSSYEIAEVLGEAKRLIPGIIYEVARARQYQRRTRYDGSSEYRVIAALEKDADGVMADRYGFTINRNCDEYLRCNWTVGVGSRIFH
jgi:hypothetical protein